MTIDKALEDIEETGVVSKKKTLVATPNYLLPKDKLTSLLNKFQDLKNKYFDVSYNNMRWHKSTILEDIEKFEPYEKMCNGMITSTINMDIEFDRWVPIFDGCINSDIVKDEGTNTKLIRPELKECITHTVDQEFRYIFKKVEKIQPNGESINYFERRVDNINRLYCAFYDVDLLIDSILLGRGLQNHIKALKYDFQKGDRLVSWSQLKKASKKRGKKISYRIYNDCIEIKK